MKRGHSISRKLSSVVVATTGSALLITAVSMAAYDLHSFRETSVRDLGAQADILALAAAPALDFEDPGAAREYLELLQAKPDVIGAAIYTASGEQFARYSAGKPVEFPSIPDADGYRFDAGEVSVFRRVVSGGEILGTVYLRAEYGLLGRVLGYLAIMTAVLALSLLAALLVSRRLQRSITEPIFEIASVARHVVERRDFGVRASKTSDDEVGVLVDGFNSMLAEIESRTGTLEESNRQLEQKEEELSTLNADLEKRVALRTAELETANKDLEGFSYSVSHDLRAPIRGIRGFCSLLEHDHGASLDAEGRRKLGIIRDEAERMGRLIDDLLAFSRLGRKALQPMDLDMTEVAQSAFRRLGNGDGAPAGELRLGSLPRARGDRALLDQVWTNLLSNAVKFSSGKDNPVVEVGGISDGHEHVFFVRDNGAGFEPEYADRLFGVFQRLHHDHEFPGTGVGLALVQRIVHRHGGRVWAEGRPGEGATFHFTLPKEPSNG